MVRYIAEREGKICEAVIHKTVLHGLGTIYAVFFLINALVMKKLTREEATQLPKRPNGNFSFIRGYLLAMKPGDFILLEKKDWTRKTQVPSTYCLWLSRQEKGEWRCETLLDKSAWVIERIK